MYEREIENIRPELKERFLAARRHIAETALYLTWANQAYQEAIVEHTHVLAEIRGISLPQQEDDIEAR